MLVAIKETGERIRANDYKTAHQIRLNYPLGSLLCPFCKGGVFARGRKGFVLHFVHQHSCTSTIARHPESPEHEEGKIKIAEFLEAQILKEGKSSATVEIEYSLPHCGEHGRVADVAVIYKNNNLLIAECQLSRITPHELEQRTRDYHAIGADVLWFLGKEADTPDNRTWLRSVFGAVGRLEFKYEPD